MRLCIENNEPYFDENSAPVPVLHNKERTVLGSGQTEGHLIAFSWWKNRIYIDAYHGLTDGGGIDPLIWTLLYYYCSDFYGKELSGDGIRLSDSDVSPQEWEDPYTAPLPEEKQGLALKWSSPAFQIAEGGIVSLIPDSIVYNIRIREDEFMRFNISNDGSPAAIAALLLARTIDALHPEKKENPVIAMCVNRRRALGSPLAHQSLVGDVRIPYTERMKSLSFTKQAACFRGMVTLQSDPDMVLDDVREYKKLAERLKTMKSTHERRKCCIGRMEEQSRCVSAAVSYVGKADFRDAEHYIQEYEALPSTALPSLHVPLTIEMSAVNGYFFINFIQYFRETDYVNMFICQLRDNAIDYDVLNTAEARYPRMELPF